MYSFLKKFWVAFCLALIGFVFYKFEGVYKTKKISSVIIIVDITGEPKLFIENAVKKHLEKLDVKLIENQFGNVNISDLKNKIKDIEILKKVYIYKSWTGALNIEIQAKRPIGRLLLPDGDLYIDEEGGAFRTSDEYPYRTVIIRMENSSIDEDSDNFVTAFLQNLHPEHKLLLDFQRNYPNIFQLLKFIYQDKFWKKLITMVSIDKNKVVTLYTQIGKQKISFGKANEIANKFNKLHIFYKRVIPEKGWDYYTKVDLRFEKQIVCQE